MIIKTTKSFDKTFQKLPKDSRNSITEAIRIFKNNPFASELKNHALKWDKLGFRAISAGFDLRVLYREEWDHAVVFLIKTGTHNQVY